MEYDSRGIDITFKFTDYSSRSVKGLPSCPVVRTFRPHGHRHHSAR